MQQSEFRRRNGRAWAGAFLLLIGGVLLLQQMNVIDVGWLFSWPALLIVIGLFIGIGSGFRGGAWLIMILVGSIFLIDRLEPGYGLRNYMWPLIIIAVGLVMILRPRTTHCGPGWRTRRPEKLQAAAENSETASQRPVSGFTVVEDNANQRTDPGDYIDSTAVFGGIRKVILSKNFKGGEAVSVFGGNEIDLSKADIHGTVQLELTQVFGGTKLIVPNHWNIRSEVVAFLGGIEDKRLAESSKVDPSKTLILKGTSVLGGIDIRNY